MALTGWKSNYCVESGITRIVSDVRVGDLVEIRSIRSKNGERGNYVGYVSSITLEQQEKSGRFFHIGLNSEHPYDGVGLEIRNQAGELLKRDFDSFIDTTEISEYRILSDQRAESNQKP